MLESTALNVVISLVFIFLLYSLLATTITEGIAATFRLRAKKLETAIGRMLDDGEMSYQNIWQLLGGFAKNSLKHLRNIVLLLSFKSQHKPKEKMSLVEAFYNYPGIKYLAENKYSNRPSYISPEFFSKAVIEILAEKANDTTAPKLQQLQQGIASITNANETKQLIQTFLNDANDDIDKFRVSLEAWFNETMQRTTGWYKRQVQKITFAVGLIIAIAFNVDTIAIVKKLSNNPESAKLMADMAASYVQLHKDSLGRLSATDSAIAKKWFEEAKMQVDEDINNTNSIIGLGWIVPADDTLSKLLVSTARAELDTTYCKTCFDNITKDSLFNKPLYVNQQHKINSPGKAKYVLCMAYKGNRKLLGYLLTALAISFGSPFWFDLLSKLIQLRGSGKRPEEAAKNTKQ